MKGTKKRAGGANRPAPAKARQEFTSPVRPIDLLLSRLQRVRQTAPNRWVMACPAHEDRSPPLSIKEAPDGSVLIRCSAGCDTQAVLDAVGLTFADLFPDCGNHRPHRVAPGSARCLCRACGEMFSTVGNFDRHRRDGECRPPATVGLVQVAGVWKSASARTLEVMARIHGHVAEVRI